MTGGSIVNFTRAFKHPVGRSEVLSVRLSFASEPDAAEACYFTCQKLASPGTSDTGLLEHGNGATGISRVVCHAHDPKAQSGVLKLLYGSATRNKDGDGLVFSTANGIITVDNPESVAEEFSIDISVTAQPFAHCGVVICVSDLDLTEAVFRENAISHINHNGRIVTEGEQPNGAFIAFENA